MKTVTKLATAAAVAGALAACAAMQPGPTDAEARAKAAEMMKASFKERGQAKLDRLAQDETQALCSQYAGEAIAQRGTGFQYSDDPAAPSGANCYACHQLSKQEISYGTIGPSLYNFGKLRGYTYDIRRYAWGKVWNAEAYSACTNMPRFGHSGILTEQQVRDVVALLMDPASPVNQ
jgi:L-cysteine S-thiosulfotransferase